MQWQVLSWDGCGKLRKMKLYRALEKREIKNTGRSFSLKKEYTGEKKGEKRVGVRKRKRRTQNHKRKKRRKDMV